MDRHDTTPSRVTLRVLVAPNSFKGTLSASAAAAAIALGVERARPGSQTVLKPMADGGDGFLETLLAAWPGGRRTHHQVSGPLGAEVRAEIGWIERRGGTAVLELAAAAGLALVGHPSPESAARAGTRGLGELIEIARSQGAAEILVGLGGSASTDGGAGLATGLGYRLLDRAGRQITPGGGGLLALEGIVAPPGYAQRSRVVAACDVANPLLGPSGAAAVYAPQKGADAATVRRLERALERLARVADRDLGPSAAARRPGAGAAGGTGFGLLRFAGAELVPGARLVAEAVGLDQALEVCDLVITGEGRFDLQSLEGKATGEVVLRARARGLPCTVLAGSAAPEALARLEGLGGDFRLAAKGGIPEEGAEAAAQLTEAAAISLLAMPPGGAPPPA
ncbi:MAG: glycerate kinase family protein [Candidatus Dormibacteria bacterium]